MSAFFSGAAVKLEGRCGHALRKICLRLGSRGITLTSKSNTVQITSKGQVTIPQEIRNRLGLLPHTEVEFEVVGDHARIRKSKQERTANARGRLAVKGLRGTADIRMTTDQIMALTRGADRPRKRRT